MKTAHALAKELRIHYGLAINSSYSAAYAVARSRGLIRPSGGVELDTAAKAETILAVMAQGSGLGGDTDLFLATIRRNGSAETLADLIRKVEAGNPEHLRESWLAIDAIGRCRWIYVESLAASSVAIGLTDFGGKPGPRCAAIDGGALAELLA
ncbi:hypothetical protein [Sulfitobacter dubius]|uniref:hypothetical protein n=1 Tax=Sulfitobacter dubius TaxID=218673 RepID=UPI0008EF3DEF|nr:hypothetical protein [Sulfitobacter dubius]SFH21094.1 hypothetical protein SAMN04488039_103550 [Sulfitobacter dubius]